MLLVLEAIEKSCYCTREHLKHEHPLTPFFCVLHCAVPTLPFTDPVFPLFLISTVISFFFCLSGGCGRALEYLFLFISFPNEKKEKDSGFLSSITHTFLKVLRSRLISRISSTNCSKFLGKMLIFASYQRVCH